ncbi:SMC family ATPase [Virgibacillus sp. NKC19-16]|uniref:AAA family ATPase n=1 Tax=Virgibacillus salidurans TaxID=2831673 RepID=UPI001F230B08|nr:SMC family ATPase [Virgibacillus sp. NKC19-16]UJL45636.1 SMC family ATPase [Virgibacillus sp. NKC19-16]
MKPLKLTLTAFGPYKNTEVIDFNDLEGNRLFVIAGNTGAGKTTIFDGICFALYGSASGQDRENSMMLRSDFANDDTHTSVELLFELKGCTYRVLRQLGHVKKGNKSKTGERYAFFEIVDGSEVPCVDRQIVSEIDKKIEVLMGLTQDQFKQIVMLPQGEFRKLLTSQTENKEEILRRLFKTEPYQQISERLRTKKKAIEDAFNQAKQTRDNYIEHIRASLPMREESLIFQVLSEEHYNEHQIIDGLDAELSFYAQQISMDQKKYEEAYKAHDKKQTEFHQAQALNERFEELSRKEGRLKELKSQVPLYEKKQKQLEDAERASKIVPYENQRQEWRAEEKNKTKILHDAENAKKLADDSVEKVQIIYQQEEAKQTEREDIRRQLDRFQEFLPIVKEIDVKKQQVQELKNKEKHAFNQLQKLQAEIKDKKAKTENYNEQIKVMDQQVSQLPDKQQKLIDMREQAKVLIDFLDLSEKQAEHKKEETHRKEVFEKQKETYTTLEKTWLNDQAHVLASHLHDGEACPVCGSHDHPRKATSESEMITKEQLDSAKQELDEKDKLYRTAAANLESITAQLKEKERAVASYSVQVDAVSTAKDQIVDEGKKLKAEVNELQTIREKLAKYKEEYEQTNEAYKQLEAKEKEAEKAHQQAKTDYETDLAVYQERIQRIPEEVRALSVLEQKIKETESVKNQLEKSWQDAQTKLQQARDEQTKATSNLTNANKQVEEAKTKRQKCDQQFIDALTQAAFDEEQAYQQAKMPERDSQHLKNDIELFNQNRSTLQEQVAELKDALKDKQHVDLRVLQERLSELKQAYEAAFKKWNQSKEYHQEAASLKTSIMDANVRVRETEKNLSTITDLYDVIRGQNMQKVSFERYLQIEYLEQIIDAANQRMKRLSNGQFFLMRSDRQESHGRQSGLTLDVYDAYTGQTRDVKTLSGGEKFNASLCLALGMSDVIQSFQGNISIETMFIDEGFGTLDEESLNKAIDALVDLQKSGRMIGVISHVQELKTIFPAVLEVRKTKEGSSRTQFVV